MLSRISFAYSLLFAVVFVNVVAAVVILANTERAEGEAIRKDRELRLERAVELLQQSAETSLKLFNLGYQSEILEIVSPVIHSSQALDMVGILGSDGSWTDQSWTSSRYGKGMQELVSQSTLAELISSDSLKITEGDIKLYARPVTNPYTNETVAYVVAGQDDQVAAADVAARMKKISFELVLVVLVQTLLIAFILDWKLRRPLTRILAKAAEIQEEHSDLVDRKAEFGTLAKIEQATEILEKSRTRYKLQEANTRSILANIKEGIVVMDSDINIQDVNQEFVSLWGYSPDEIIGQPIWKIFHEKHWESQKRGVQDYKQTGVAEMADTIFNLTAVDMNGREFPVEFILSECIVGKERRFVAAISDVSEQKRQREELLKAKNEAESAQSQAEEATEAKAAFLANMSHEIRTPMNGVMGLLDLISDTDLDSQQAAMIRTAKVSAESLLNVLNDILDISKIEAGKIDLEYTEFDIKSVFEEVVTLFNVAATDKGLELNCYVDPNLTRCVMGDPTRVRQIVSNVLGNAVKFTQIGEVEARLDIREKESGRLSILMSIRDTGIGMSKKALETVFDQFTQADDSTTRKFGGTGLGMAISKQLAELMGGSINVTSEIGEGTRFIVEFDCALGQARPSQHRDSLLLPSTRVLVVDDNETNRNIIQAYLNNWGIESRAAKDAYEALEYVESEDEAPFDICLTDYHMPGMDGIELTRTVREKGCATDMIFAMLNSGTLDSAELESVEIKHSLIKPIRQSDLFDLIARARHVFLKSDEKKEVAQQESFSGRVLLVEDNAVNQLVAKSMLEKLGVSVTVAENGQEGNEALKADNYDLVFMDCLMPVMDGYEATRERRRFESEQGTPRANIVALTANAMSGDREKCIDAGMDDFLSKPIKIEDLKEALRYWLPANLGGIEPKPAAPLNVAR